MTGGLMQLGIFAKTFPGTEPAAVLAAVRDAGYAAPSSTWPASACRRCPMRSRTMRSAPSRRLRCVRRSLVALSGTYNMIHPDPAVRADGLRRLATSSRGRGTLHSAGHALHRHARPRDQWAHHPDNAEPAAWADLAEMEKALGWPSATASISASSRSRPTS